MLNLNLVKLVANMFIWGWTVAPQTLFSGTSLNPETSGSVLVVNIGQILTCQVNNTLLPDECPEKLHNCTNHILIEFSLLQTSQLNVSDVLLQERKILVKYESLILHLNSEQVHQRCGNLHSSIKSTNHRSVLCCVNQSEESITYWSHTPATTCDQRYQRRSSEEEEYQQSQKLLSTQ